MAKELEVRFLNINKKKLIQKLDLLKAKKKFDYIFKTRAFDLGEDRNFIRIRDEVDKITLSHKINLPNSIESTEFEVEVGDFEKAYQFAKSLGFPEKVYLEKRRERYILNGCFIDIDTWPKIPTYVEIEGKSVELIKEVSKILDFNFDDAHKGNAFDVFRLYGVEPNNYKILTFKIEELN